jgi:hypothetical protein
MQGIYHVYQINLIVYTENLDGIYIAYAMYMICIFFLHSNYIPKLNMEMLCEGQGSWAQRDDNHDAAESTQLFFHCMLSPIGARVGGYNCCY